MPKMLLTQNFVDNASCDDSQSKIDYYDTKTHGLVLKVLKSGKRNYYLRYRNQRYVTCEKRLSNVDASVLKLNEARQMASQFLSAIAMGKDPFEEQKTKRNMPRFADFIAESYLPFVKGYKRSWQTDESIIRNHLLPAFGDCYLDEISKRDIISLLGQHRETYAPGSVNRLLILLRYIFNCARRWDIPNFEQNPTASIPLLEENNKKERYLSKTDVQALFDAVNHSENPILKYIIPMLILTGARKREVLDAQWTEFDFQRRVWRISMSKSGKARYVPMSDALIDLFKHLPRYAGCGYVFVNEKTKRPFVNIFCAWDTARKKAGLPNLRIHDLRHSFASFLINNGRSLYEVQKILGHTQIKTTQRYAHLSSDTLLDATNVVAKAISLADAMPNSGVNMPLLTVQPTP